MNQDTVIPSKLDLTQKVMYYVRMLSQFGAQ